MQVTSTVNAHLGVGWRMICRLGRKGMLPTVDATYMASGKRTQQFRAKNSLYFIKQI